MNLMSLDLEMNQPSQKIIQIGWTIGDPVSGYTYEVKGEYVSLDEQLNPIISDLCGVEQSVLDKADPLLTVYNKCRNDYKRYECRTVLVWGEGDLKILKSQMKPFLDNNETDWPFGMASINAKSLYQSWKLKQGQPHLKGGLARALTKFKDLSSFQGRKHNACDDAYNTYRIYKRLLLEFK